MCIRARRKLFEAAIEIFIVNAYLKSFLICPALFPTSYRFEMTFFLTAS